MKSEVALKFLKALATEAHECSVAHGFWTCVNCGRTRDEHQSEDGGKKFRCNLNPADEFWKPRDRNFGEVVALMHSELSEALEDDRSGKLLVETTDGLRVAMFRSPGKPTEGFTEFADLLVRLGDWLGQDMRRVQALALALEVKMRYNASRPFKHGRSY